MKQLTFLLLLSIAGQVSYAQNKNLDAKFALKLYNLSSWEKKVIPAAQGIFTGTETIKQNQLFHPAIAFRIRNKKNNFHEIELTNLEVGTKNTITEINYNQGMLMPIAGAKTTTSAIAVRYEYILNFLKKRNSRFMPSLGLALMPYYMRTNFDPVLATQFPVTNTRMGAKGFLVPRLNYAITSRLLVDVNVPFCITDSYVERVNQRNPNITQREQKYETGNFDGIPNRYSFRVGLGLTI